MAHQQDISADIYVSSRRASEETGYAQDYIGYLARKGFIDAKRVAGVWNVSLPSLRSYKEQSDQEKVARAREMEQPPEQEAYLSFDGKDYLSTPRAAEITGYNQDYVSQLARRGNILSRQVGKRWYVERSGIEDHRREKDALLAAVQAKSVGLLRHSNHSEGDSERLTPHEANTHYTYPQDDGDLLPDIEVPRLHGEVESHSIAIRIVPETHVSAYQHKSAHVSATSSQSVRRGPQYRILLLASTLLTVVIVLSLGYVTLQSSATYAKRGFGSSEWTLALSERAEGALSDLAKTLEKLLVPEMTYRRSR